MENTNELNERIKFLNGKLLATKKTEEKLKSDNKALQEVIDFYVESTKDHNTHDKLKGSNDDNKALSEQIIALQHDKNIYYEDNNRLYSDYKKLSDMCDKLAEGMENIISCCDGNIDEHLVFYTVANDNLTKYNKLKGGKE